MNTHRISLTDEQLEFVRTMRGPLHRWSWTRIASHLEVSETTLARNAEAAGIKTTRLNRGRSSGPQLAARAAACCPDGTQ